MQKGLLAAIAVLWIGVGIAGAQAPQRPAHQFAKGQKVEIKSQRDWQAVTIVRREGDWYLVSHERTNWREWVEYWRIRRLRTTTDDLPPIQSHGFVHNNEPPPTARVSPKPPPGDQLSWASERVKAAQQADAPPAPGVPAAPGANDAPAPGLPDTTGAPAPPPIQLEIDPAHVPALKLSPLPADPLPEQPRIALQALPVQAELDRLILAPAAKTLLLGFAEPSRGFDQSRGFVERVDLQAGRSVGLIELAPGLKLLDASDDGATFIAARIGEDDSRIDLWAETDGKFVARFGFNPLAGEQWPHNRIKSARLGGDGTRMLVSNDWDKIVCVDTRTGATLWQQATRGGAPLHLDSARRHAIFEIDNALVFVSLADGKPVGKLEMPPGATRRFTFSPDTTRLICVIGQTLRTFSLDDQPAPEPVSLATSIEQIVAIDRAIVLVNRSLLVDIERGALIATLSAEQVKGLLVAGDGSAIYVVPEGRGAVSCHPLLSPALRTRAIEPSAQLALARGQTVRVSYDLQCAPEVQQKLREHAGKAIADADLKVADAGAIHLVYRSVPGESREVTFRRLHGREQETIHVTEQVTTLTIELNGQPIWSSRSTFTGQGFLDVKQGQSFADAVQVARDAAIASAGQTPLPTRLLQPAERLSLPNLPLPPASAR